MIADANLRKVLESLAPDEIVTLWAYVLEGKRSEEGKALIRKMRFWLKRQARAKRQKK